MAVQTKEPLTLWRLCQTLNAEELSRIMHVAISDNGTTELNSILSARLRLKPRKCKQLTTEVIRTARLINGGSSDDSVRGAPTRESIIHQLNIIVGIVNTPRPWKLEVAASSASGGSGDGVFLRGACAAHTVLAIYPGVAYTSADLPSVVDALEGNHYALFLRNGVVIDGRPDVQSSEAFERAWRQHNFATLPPMEDCTLAVGHMVNHPPRGVRPNVYVLPLEFTDEEAAGGLRAHLPVVDACTLVDDRARVGGGSNRTAVLVASRALHDEELWLDYKLRAQAHALPEWYTPCDGHGDMTSYYY